MANVWGAGMHWTGSGTAWCGFFANLKDGRVLLRHELTWRKGVPEVAARDIKALVEKLKQLTLAENATASFMFTGIVANPSLWLKDAKSTGQSTAETFIRNGAILRRGNGDRENGWSRLRSWLNVQEWPAAKDGDEPFRSPALLIHEDCREIVRCIPTLISDPKNPDDIVESVEEYPANGLRYYAMSRPTPSADVPRVMPPDAIGHSLQQLRDEIAAESY